MTQPVARSAAPFRWSYLGWLICLLVIIYAVFAAIGVFPGDIKAAFACIAVLALALFFGTLP